jgi:hypothetical protein
MKLKMDNIYTLGIIPLSIMALMALNLCYIGTIITQLQYKGSSCQAVGAPRFWILLVRCRRTSRHDRPQTRNTQSRKLINLASVE